MVPGAANTFDGLALIFGCHGLQAVLLHPAEHGLKAVAPTHGKPENQMGSESEVLVLAGGPDRERDVSLKSGAQVAAALRDAGHTVTEADLSPDHTTALDHFVKAHPRREKNAVIFPVFHGKWGEGGGAQALLEKTGLPYVGCRPEAAALCMDKARTKLTLRDAGLPTPDYELVDTAFDPTIAPPVVVKPNDDGSSIDLRICPDAESLAHAWAHLSPRYRWLLVERLITGREVTVGIVEDETGTPVALPPIHIQPATPFYDYAAKYERDDTRYHFDLGLSPDQIAALQTLAVQAFTALGVRHLGRVDLFIDHAGKPWIIEINTMPGFTTHSLLPMAAAHAGRPLPQLADHLVRHAAASVQ